MKACESNPNQFTHDCCEKARKWDELQSRNAHIDFGVWLQDTKLRELIEKEELDTEETFCDECWQTIRKLLLEEKKK